MQISRQIGYEGAGKNIRRKGKIGVGRKGI
jgi:hypothetical protein